MRLESDVDGDANTRSRHSAQTSSALPAPTRHRTLCSLIDWSCDLLNAKEQTLYRRLATHAGGWKLAAAARVCAGAPIAERPAAASVTSVPRSLASAASPFLAGWMLTISSFGWPLIAAGGLKIVYDLLLLAFFRKVKPPEERRDTPPGD